MSNALLEGLGRYRAGGQYCVYGGIRLRFTDQRTAAAVLFLACLGYFYFLLSLSCVWHDWHPAMPFA
ncbi:hypothetical protein [Serratia marcescens]|uniref:hypothetical protein n=1 Tax=Serratia marcescens TaxID=615 RepID=UPI003F7EAF13